MWKIQKENKIGDFYLTRMCHIHVEAPMVTNWFPNILQTSLFFGSKQSMRLLIFYLVDNNLLCFEPKN